MPTQTNSELLERIKEDLSKRVSEKRYKHTASVVSTAIKIASHIKQLNLEDFDIDIKNKLKPIQDTLTPSYLEKIELAAWLHDSCKEIKGMELLKLAEFYKIKVFDEDIEYPNILHARVGAAWLEEEYDIVDPHIILAVKEHTLGGNNMLLSSKILYLADLIEPYRDSREKDANPDLVTDLDIIRSIIFNDHNLDKALLAAMNHKIKEVLEENRLIHPISVETRNNLVTILGF